MSQDSPSSAIVLPSSLRERLEGYDFRPSAVGESDAHVFRLRSASGQPDLYLKYADGSAADDLTDEMSRLRWLAAYLPVPDVVSFFRDHDRAWLLTTVLEGASAYDLLESEPARREAVVDALACFMLRLHAIPAERCPFNSQLPLRLHRARQRIDDGLVETDDFDDERDGWTAEQVWAAIHAYHLPNSAPVVTHGDFSLDNILIIGDAVSGCVDVGRLGIADRYQDLAILWNCLREFGPELQERLFRQYGLCAVDRDLLDLHLSLDELF